MRRSIYVEQIYATDGIIHFALANAFTANGPPLTFRLSSSEANFSGTLPSNRVRFPNFKAQDPMTVWRLEIEGCIAYQAQIPWSSAVSVV